MAILTFSFEGVLQLDLPFGFGAVHFEHSNSHDEDNDTTDSIFLVCFE